MKKTVLFLFALLVTLLSLALFTNCGGTDTSEDGDVDGDVETEGDSEATESGDLDKEATETETEVEGEVEGEVTAQCTIDTDCLSSDKCTNKECVTGTWVCIGSKYNQDCADKYGFQTQKWGTCEPVKCDNDADCAGLQACDDPNKTSSTNFACDTNKECYRK
jgi:hypothetical protein